MDPKTILHLASQNDNMSSVDRLTTIYWIIRYILLSNINGEVVEVGCNCGMTSVFLQMLIEEFDESRELHVYDSFQGMPAPSTNDAYLHEGDCSSSVEELKRLFDEFRTKLPTIHPGWFHDTLPNSLPKTIAFAYLDSDFYDSIKTSLECVYPKLSPGGIILVDDYGDPAVNPNAWDGLPGVKIATDEFCKSIPEKPTVLVSAGDLSMVYIAKNKIIKK